MPISSDLYEKFDYSRGDDDDYYDNDFHSSTPLPDHSNQTLLIAKELAEIYGPGNQVPNLQVLHQLCIALVISLY